MAEVFSFFYKDEEQKGMFGVNDYLAGLKIKEVELIQ